MSLRKNINKQMLPIITAGLIVVAYVPILVWMWDRWFARDSYYSHGILIPFVSAFLIWQKREELSRTVKKRSRAGVVLMVAGAVAYLLSAVLRVYFSSGFSMLVVVFGFVLHFYGRDVLKKIIFPICFLFFMFPLPLVAIINISFKMKLFAATIATQVLNGMGLYARQEGSIIVMRHAHVIVDDVCSGLRSLISLMALGSIFAYWLKAPMWKRAFLFALTMPIAIITNVFRVVVLSWISEIFGVEYAAGFIHDFMGFSVFALAVLLLMSFSKVIE